MPRFAIITVVDAPNADEAVTWVGDELARGIHWDHPLDARFVSDAYEVAPLDEYETRPVATAIVTHPRLEGNENSYDPRRIYCPECRGPAQPGSRNRISATHVEYRCASCHGFFVICDGGGG